MFMHKGFFLTKIASIGDGKPIALKEFAKGVNILSGASETGKSYIFECIDFVFGSRDQPKPIAIAEGYDHIRAEFQTYDGKQFTISRKFGDNFVYLAETTLGEFSAMGAKKLSTTHSSVSELNISTYLLTLLGLEKKRLKFNNLNKTRSLSFRDLSMFCLINEEKVIQSTSPIYSGQNNEETKNKALFKLLLTGLDDDDLDEIKNQDIAKANIKGKIELTQENFQKKEKNLLELKQKVDKLELEEINVKIDELVAIVNSASSSVSHAEKERQIVWNDLDKNKSAINQTLSLIEQFQSLNKHYDSDLGRLEFVNEGKQYIDQIAKVNCPLCDSLIDQKLLEPYEENDPAFLESVKSEYEKIRKKQLELTETVSELHIKKKELEILVASLQNEFYKINQHILNKLKPLQDANRKDLEQFIELKSQKNEVSLLENELSELKRDERYYQEKLTERQERAVEIVMPEEIYKELADEIKKILNSWGIKCQKVTYDPTVNDIEIDGEARNNSGKGYRAVYLAAFMIAVMLFCLKKKLKHPYFLVLDSPLTSYKEKDIAEGGAPSFKDKLPENVQDAFYRSITDLLDQIKDLQIVIIDNKDPPEDIKKRVHFEHFSKNPNKGRYGFYKV